MAAGEETMDRVPLGFHATTTLSTEEAEQALREELTAEGFDVVAEIDLQSILREKVDVEIETYKLLAVCAPELAHRAMRVWHGFGLLAPCHVAVWDAVDHRVVLVFDPMEIREARDNAELLPVAEQTRDALERVLTNLELRTVGAPT
jgi:uncharacterized protein (DUF302 family)